MIMRAVDSLNDWEFGKGLANYNRDNDAIKENIKTRLLSWLGDCFFALNEGIDWKGRLDVGQQANLTQEVRTMIVKSYGVVGIDSVTVTMDDVFRHITITYNIQTIYGQKFTSTIEQLLGS